MDLIKSGLWDIFGGMLVGGLVESVMPGAPGVVTAGTAPRLLLEICVETLGISFLTKQYFDWISRSRSYRYPLPSPPRSSHLTCLARETSRTPCSSWGCTCPPLGTFGS
jgi:hypothetical protein